MLKLMLRFTSCVSYTAWLVLQLLHVAAPLVSIMGLYSSRCIISTVNAKDRNMLCKAILCMQHITCSRLCKITSSRLEGYQLARPSLKIRDTVHLI